MRPLQGTVIGMYETYVTDGLAGLTSWLHDIGFLIVEAREDGDTADTLNGEIDCALALIETWR